MLPLHLLIPILGIYFCIYNTTLYNASVLIYSATVHLHSQIQKQYTCTYRSQYSSASVSVIVSVSVSVSISVSVSASTCTHRLRALTDPNTVHLHVSGDGVMADIHRVILSAFDKLMQGDVSQNTRSCIAIPAQPRLDIYKIVGNIK